MGKKSCCNLKCCLIALGVVGGILVIIGGISVTVFNLLFEQIIIQEGTIAEGTIMYDAWSEVTTPTYMSYWFYNVTNPDEFMAQTKGDYVAPRMQEVGPYVFREYYKKDSIEFLTDLNPEEVFFQQQVTLIFEPDKSAGPLTDMVTTLNLVGASVGPIVEYIFAQSGTAVPPAVYLAVNQLYREAGTELLFTRSAHDLLFGFYDNLYTNIVNLLENATGVDLPDTFGLFSTSNDSRGWFNYTVYTGKDHPELINIITSYDDKKNLTYWGSDECNMINGTDGTSSPPFMSKEEKVYFFVDDVCRSLYGTFSEEVTVKKVTAWKYVIPAEVFQNPIDNPDNICFCPDPDEPLCQHDGAISLQSCQAGAPVVVSLPHFWNGDGYYLSQTEGVSEPTAEEHEVALYYEPNTGTVIKVDKRLQINFALRNNPKINFLNKIEGTIMFPVVWLNESALVGDDDADLLYGLLVVPAEIVFILQIVLCIVGSIMFLTPIVYALFAKGQKKDKDAAGSKYEMKDPSTPKRNHSSKYVNYDDVTAKENKGFEF